MGMKFFCFKWTRFNKSRRTYHSVAFFYNKSYSQASCFRWDIKLLLCCIWYDMIRYMIRCDMIRYMMLYDMIRYDTTQYDTILYYTIRYDTIRYDTIRYDIWYDMIYDICYDIYDDIIFINYNWVSPGVLGR